MANASILAAFERMWQHITAVLAGKADSDHVQGVTYGGTGLEGVSKGNYLVGNDENGMIAKTPEEVWAHIGSAGKSTNEDNHAEVFNDYENNVANGNYSHAEGYSTSAGGASSHAEGDNTESYGIASHAEGYQTIAFGDYSHAEGYSEIVAPSDMALDPTNPISREIEEAWVDNAKSFSATNGIGSHCEGECTLALGDASHAEGRKTLASGIGSHAEGVYTIASGEYCHAEGNGSTSSGYHSHAEGEKTTATNRASHAEGIRTTASGRASHAEGLSTTASEDCSHAEGIGTTALGGQHAQGHYNNTANAQSGNVGTGTGTAFVIGNGTSSAASNAFRVDYNGTPYAKSALTTTGADYAEYFEWQDLNPNQEDRRGYFVTLDGDKIKIAEPNDYILGIISGQPSVIGNGDEDWMGRYVLDEFGAFVYEDFEYTDNTDATPVIKTGKKYKENPDYDPSIAYTQRADRPEWAAVGMLGVLSVRDDGTCKVNGYCKVANGGIATSSESGYRVIKRVNDNIVKVIFR